METALQGQIEGPITTIAWGPGKATKNYSASPSKFEQNTPEYTSEKSELEATRFGFTTDVVRPFGFTSTHYLPGIQSSSPVQADNENKVDTCMV